MEAGEWVPTTSWSLVERLQDAGMLERSTDYSESDDDCEELPPVGLGAKFDLDASLQVLAPSACAAVQEQVCLTQDILQCTTPTALRTAKA